MNFTTKIILTINSSTIEKAKIWNGRLRNWLQYERFVTFHPIPQKLIDIDIYNIEVKKSEESNAPNRYCVLLCLLLILVAAHNEKFFNTNYSNSTLFIIFSHINFGIYSAK